MIFFICCGNKSLKLGKCFGYLSMALSKKTKTHPKTKKMDKQKTWRPRFLEFRDMFLDKQNKLFLRVFLFCYLTKESFILNALKQKILDLIKKVEW